MLFAASFLAGCGQSEPVEKVVPKTIADFFEIGVAGHPVQMQLALLKPEMERGLMGRRELGQDEGMLFVYLRPQRMSFWMRNTPLPLDIGFFDASGILREVYALHPYDETPVATRSEEVQMALEMNQGWFKANNVRVGDKLDLKALASALRERDFRPEQFKLATSP